LNSLDIIFSIRESYRYSILKIDCLSATVDFLGWWDRSLVLC